MRDGSRGWKVSADCTGTTLPELLDTTRSTFTKGVIPIRVTIIRASSRTADRAPVGWGASAMASTSDCHCRMTWRDCAEVRGTSAWAISSVPGR